MGNANGLRYLIHYQCPYTLRELSTIVVAPLLLRHYAVILLYVCDANIISK